MFGYAIHKFQVYFNTDIHQDTDILTEKGIIYGGIDWHEYSTLKATRCGQNPPLNLTIWFR